MQIFVRVDSSTNIGTGHVMRCLTLAKQLKKMNFDVEFISKKLGGDISQLVKKNGFKVHHLDKKLTISKSSIKDAEQTIKIINKNSKILPYLIIDHYDLDIKWEKRLREFVNKIIVIDDLADRKHDCDLLIDQNFYNNLKNRYNKLLSKRTVKLLGPKYAMLRDEFFKFRKKVKPRKKFRKLLISFGGTDSTNETRKVLKSIKFLKNEKLERVHVIFGGANKNEIKKLCQPIPNVKLHSNVKNIAEFMYNSDFAIGAGGSTIWERFCLGLPTYVSVVALHQKETTDALAKKECLINMGMADIITVKRYAKILDNIDKKKLYRISKNSLKIVDGKGTTRVANHIRKLN